MYLILKFVYTFFLYILHLPQFVNFPVSDQNLFCSSDKICSPLRQFFDRRLHFVRDDSALQNGWVLKKGSLDFFPNFIHFGRIVPKATLFFALPVNQGGKRKVLSQREGEAGLWWAKQQQQTSQKGTSNLVWIEDQAQRSGEQKATNGQLNRESNRVKFGSKSRQK